MLQGSSTISQLVIGGDTQDSVPSPAPSVGESDTASNFKQYNVFTMFTVSSLFDVL